MENFDYIHVVSDYILTTSSLHGDEKSRKVGERKCWAENLFGGDRNKNFVLGVLRLCFEPIL